MPLALRLLKAYGDTAAAVGAGLALAWFTAASPLPFDAPEITAAAFELGASHAPGQSLHAFLGHFATWLPLGPVTWRLGLFSAALATLAACAAAGLTRRLLAWFDAAPSPARTAAPYAVAAATLLGPTLLRQALRVEVYSLALFVSLLAVRQLVEWAVAEHGLKHALRAAFLTGLLCALDLPQALGVACVAVPAVLLKGGPVTRRVRALGISIPAFLVGGAALAYLPARAHAGANMWGDPTSWAGFWNYVSGAAYDANGGVGVEGLDFAARVSTVALHVALASGIAPLAGMALFGAGILRLPESTRRFAVAVALAPLVALIPVGECAFDPSLPDHVAYLALGVTLLIVVGAVGFVLIPASGALRWLPFALVLGLGMNIPAFSEVRALPNADAPALETLAGAAVDGVPPRSLVVVASDFFCTSWLLAQAVDGARPDVAHLCSGLATEAWHWRSLGAHPVFSGNPIRGAGRTPTEQFTRGAIAQGIDHIPVLAEASETLGGHGAVAGPYLMLDAHGVPTRDAVWAESIAERLLAGDRWAWSSADVGDEDSGGGVLRATFVTRALRLASRARFKLALAALGRTLGWLPADQREVLAFEAERAIHPPAPPVRTPRAVFQTREDMVRYAAIMLDAIGAPDRAEALLERQASRGDALAYLQLAWLAFRSGDRARAEASLLTFGSVAPELKPEAAPLLAELGADDEGTATPGASDDNHRLP